jgi:hypothetical protein
METELTLDLPQLLALEKGMTIRNRFLQRVSNIGCNSMNTKYPHSYFYSPPGTGKTYSIINHLEKNNHKYVVVSGNVSMYAFMVSLCVVYFLNKEREDIIIVIDDCDEILSTEANCNIMKNALVGSQTLVYEKSLSSQWQNLNELQKAAIKSNQSDERSGFIVPCHNMSFVFTSNFKLPIDDEVRIAREKNQSKATLLAHKNAIRSRCNVADFDLRNEEHFGWIADVVLFTECLSSNEFTEQDKIQIINFMWHNWDNLTERSIRLVEKMAIILKQYPNSFNEIWKIDFLK